MIIHTIPVGIYQANCYILSSEKSSSGLIIDPGDEPEKIKNYLNEHNITVKSILLTHAHFDHIMGVREVKGKAKIYLHEEDLPLYENLKLQAHSYGIDTYDSPPVDAFLNGGNVLESDDIKIEVIHTPGHSPGSCCFKIENNLFTGDTLFKMGVGRTDLWKGSHVQLIQSINDKLFFLDDTTTVYPGHGDITTIGDEKAANPFLT
ncbi:MBL fold metallo-hydrolase [candidate division KSB1 bacterium]